MARAAAAVAAHIPRPSAFSASASAARAVAAAAAQQQGTADAGLRRVQPNNSDARAAAERDAVREAVVQQATQQAVSLSTRRQHLQEQLEAAQQAEEAAQRLERELRANQFPASGGEGAAQQLSEADRVALEADAHAARADAVLRHSQREQQRRLEADRLAAHFPVHSRDASIDIQPSSLPGGKRHFRACPGSAAAQPPIEPVSAPVESSPVEAQQTRRNKRQQRVEATAMFASSSQELCAHTTYIYQRLFGG